MSVCLHEFSSRVQQLVALLSALQPFNPLAMHLLGHLLVPLLLLLGFSAVFDALDVRLYTPSVHVEEAVQAHPHLPLCLFLLLHLPLPFLDGLLVLPCLLSLRVRGQARRGAEGFFGIAPVFSCSSDSVSDSR